MPEKGPESRLERAWTLRSLGKNLASWAVKQAEAAKLEWEAEE